eukprot:COSAG06_NODE_42945_length_377_cov_0.294964_1_plen_30_part_10
MGATRAQAKPERTAASVMSDYAEASAGAPF